MRVLLVGATGLLGGAVREALAPRHEVIGAARSGADIEVDMRDPASIGAMYEQVGAVDAVACAAGEAPWKPFDTMTAEDIQAGLDHKLRGQIELVRLGIPHVSDDGSFTLITGIVGRAVFRTVALAATVNGGIETFVRAATLDLPGRRRINAVSPTVFEEALDRYADYFPGFLPVPVAHAAAAYVRSIEGTETGRVFEIGN